MRENNLTKEEANARHAIRRARERYGLHLTEADLVELDAQLNCGFCTRKLRQETLRRSVWRAFFRDKWVTVVREENHKAGRRGVVTFLPYTCPTKEEVAVANKKTAKKRAKLEAQRRAQMLEQALAPAPPPVAAISITFEPEETADLKKAV